MPSCAVAPPRTGRWTTDPGLRRRREPPAQPLSSGGAHNQVDHPGAPVCAAASPDTAAPPRPPPPGGPGPRAIGAPLALVGPACDFHWLPFQVLVYIQRRLHCATTTNIYRLNRLSLYIHGGTLGWMRSSASRRPLRRAGERSLGASRHGAHEDTGPRYATVQAFNTELKTYAQAARRDRQFTAALNDSDADVRGAAQAALNT